MRKHNNLGATARSAGILALALSALPLHLDAAPVDGSAVAKLVSGRTWQLKKPRGPGNDYWSWSADGSVCMRLGEKTGKCDDTGRWKLDGARLCYELTWWGAESGMKSACFRVAELEKNRYGALQDNGLNLFEFSLLK